VRRKTTDCTGAQMLRQHTQFFAGAPFYQQWDEIAHPTSVKSRMCILNYRRNMLGRKLCVPSSKAMLDLFDQSRLFFRHSDILHTELPFVNV
jgi:hypothetical protein